MQLGTSNFGGEKPYSGALSVTTNGNGLASRIGSALSKVVWMNNNAVNDDEEVTDLI
jgi:hypothetical protein